MSQVDAISRVRNVAAALADAQKRLDREARKLHDAVALARQEGIGEVEITRAVQASAHGRPDRARALEAFAAAGRVEGVSG